MSDLDSVNWPALERMFACRDYGRGFWSYVSPHFAERNSRAKPPSDGARRWSARWPASTDDVVSGEFTAKELH